MLVYIYRVRFPVGPSEFELKTEFPIVIINMAWYGNFLFDIMK